MSAVFQAVVLATIGVTLLSVWFAIFRHYIPKIRAANRRVGNGEKTRRCPLCGSALGRGENVKSALFPGTGDRIMHVFGCPHCAPPYGELNRVCPVCKKVIPAEGFVIGRYFEKPGRNHLHVLGCTACRDRDRRNHQPR